MSDGNMNTVLRRVALVTGAVLLLISIYWSQDGFNFSVAGDSGGGKTAIYIGYALAIAVTVIQFVFSTNLRELNLTLVVFGLVAYAYSIYTNKEGIIHFQGTSPNETMAWVLGFAMDGVPEPLMAWGLKESLSGDFVGNIFKGIGMFFTGKSFGSNGHSQPKQQQQSQSKQEYKPQGKGGGFDRRAKLAAEYHGSERREPSTQPRNQMGFQTRNLEKNPLTDEELDAKIKSYGYKTTPEK